MKFSVLTALATLAALTSAFDVSVTFYGENNEDSYSLLVPTDRTQVQIGTSTPFKTLFLSMLAFRMANANMYECRQPPSRSPRHLARRRLLYLCGCRRRECRYLCGG